jgi:hypothetical protein
VSSLILFPLFATGVVDIVGKFTAGVVDTNGNLPPVSMIPEVAVANLPPVSLVSVVHLDLKYLGGIKLNKKFEMALILFSGAWGEDDSCKKPEANKSCHTVPLRITVHSMILPSIIRENSTNSLRTTRILVANAKLWQNC